MSFTVLVCRTDATFLFPRRSCSSRTIGDDPIVDGFVENLLVLRDEGKETEPCDPCRSAFFEALSLSFLLRP